jgi:hypothetical protein
MSEDHSIYLEVYQQALDTPAKKKAIIARKRALAIQQMNLNAPNPMEM